MTQTRTRRSDLVHNVAEIIAEKIETAQTYGVEFTLSDAREVNSFTGWAYEMSADRGWVRHVEHVYLTDDALEAAYELAAMFVADGADNA